MILTHDNYHSLANRYLTNSRIGDYLNDKKFFSDCHITGIKTKEITLAIRIGKASDTWLTGSRSAFESRFYPSAKATDDPNRFTPKQYDELVELCEKVEEQPAYHALKNYETQRIFKFDMPIGEHFCGIACIPDWVLFEGDTCHLRDFKTASYGNEKKYHYHCEEFGYYKQFAHMTAVIRRCMTEIKNFTYGHLVADKTNRDVYKCYVHWLNNERIEMEEAKLMRDIIPEIASMKEFKSDVVDWCDATEIGALINEF